MIFERSDRYLKSFEDFFNLDIEVKVIGALQCPLIKIIIHENNNIPLLDTIPKIIFYLFWRFFENGGKTSIFLKNFYLSL